MSNAIADITELVRSARQELAELLDSRDFQSNTPTCRICRGTKRAILNALPLLDSAIKMMAQRYAGFVDTKPRPQSRQPLKLGGRVLDLTPDERKLIELLKSQEEFSTQYVVEALYHTSDDHAAVTRYRNRAASRQELGRLRTLRCRTNKHLSLQKFPFQVKPVPGRKFIRLEHAKIA